MRKKKKPIPYKKIKEMLGYTKKDLDYIDAKAEILIAAMEIRKTRKKLGITQDELAKKTGIHRTTISKIERGWRDIPVGKLAKIAVAMNRRLEVKFV
jgi:DNA-binding XRE family transcriptional regulator